MDPSLETKLKKSIRKAFSNNSILQRVCQEIAAGVGEAHKLLGTYKTMQVCAIMKQNDLRFDANFDKDNIWT